MALSGEFFSWRRKPREKPEKSQGKLFWGRRPLQLDDQDAFVQGQALLGTASFPTADWRSQRKVRGEGAFVGSGNKVMPPSEKDSRIKELEAELRETKRANDKS